jgi:four helix bundle protein
VRVASPGRCWALACRPPLGLSVQDLFDGRCTSLTFVGARLLRRIGARSRGLHDLRHSAGVNSQFLIGFGSDVTIGAEFRGGMADAPVGRMAGAKQFSQLTVWQLADALRVEVLKVTRTPSCASDWKYRSQLEDAIDSVCRNIAEGFGADTHAQFAWFLRSRRSLNEVSDALRSALLKQYTTPVELSPAFNLMRRLNPALNNFIAYLERTPNVRQRPN